MQSKAHLCPKCGENTIYFDGICHSCRQKQRREEILNLGAGEVEAMILKIADRIDEIEKWDEICNDFWALFSLLDIHDPRIARAAAAKQIYYPPEIYFGAPKDVRDSLIAKLDSLQDNSKNALNHLLRSLAWQGDEQTMQLFYELYQNPRPWRQKLYAGTEIYAQIGGWSFDQRGERKSLVFDKCLAVVRARDGAEKNGGCANGRGDENANEISNFKGGAGGENYEQNAQNGVDKTSNLHAGAQSAHASMDEDAILQNERANFKSDAQKDASGSLNLSENAKDARYEGANQNADEPVQIGKPTGQKCEFCGCEMLDMLRLKADEPRLAFLNLKRDAIFRCCPTCVGSVMYFCKCGADGELQMRCEGEGMEKSYFSQQDMARLSGMKFKLSGEVSPFYGCFSELDTTVGGYPQWVQDAAYLSCPSCGGTMKHLAQIPFGELVQGEGIIYVQICEKCEVLGGCFQCT
ncbi:cytochrome C [uncultured Campylobacter sp.]|mgnify:FL=1|uniref:cytochrome C n=1 Tax=uncultured Campylobacter sp. TaxID=218934 RepID=UPI00261F9B34|nr:cytochrome C [uncultured Campylobacter sp.]